MIQPTIDTTTYGKPKSSGGGNGKTVINYNVNANTNTSGNINARSATINNILADYIKANKIESTYGNVTYLISSDGTIGTLRGDTLTYGAGDIRNLNSDLITTNELNASTANISNLFNNYLQSREITTDYLTVNKSFHAFEMIIDKIKSVGGTILNTATSCILDYVQTLDINKHVTNIPQNVKYYRCYWKATDDSGNATSNDWLEHDQAISQNCHLVSGQNHNAGNHYYWRVVDAVSQDTCFVNFNTGQVVDARVAPPYKIQFSPIEGALFTYDNGGTDTGDQFSTLVHITDWDVSSEITGDWDATNSRLTIQDTAHGLQLIPPEQVVIAGGGADGSDITEPYFISAGKFTFSTTKKAKLNFAVYFDDDTIEYHTYPSEIDINEEQDPTGDYYYYDSTNDRYIFNFEIIGGEAYAVKITITSDEVNIWHSCHWIDLSDVSGYYDEPTHLVGEDYDMDPQPNDNLVQLGYRFDELTSEELSEMGYDGTRSDTAGQSLTMTYNNATDKQAWKDSHVDEVSRASAIIIAAFKTPDQGNPLQNIRPVIPPSYAQYQEITDFDLYRYRGTYFDASGAYIKGNIVAGSNIDQSVVGFEAWSIISNVEYILDDGNGGPNPSSATITINYNDGSNWTTYNTLPSGKKLYINGADSGITAGNTMTVTFNTLTDYVLSLRDTTGNTIYGQLTIEYFDIHAHDGEDGTNGDYDEWIYKNAASQPSTPTSSGSAIPTGWSKTPTSPSTNQYTWMSTRHVTGTTGGYTYGSWTTPIRITGEDGEAGTDGTYSEYIYFRNDGATPPLYQYGQSGERWTIAFNNRKYITEDNDQYGFITYWYGQEYNKDQSEVQKVQSAKDYLPISYVSSGSYMYTDWHDHPQGITSTYTHEWISTRQYDGNTKTWGEFSTPVIWSKWGENGMDGDGYEYVFLGWHSGTCPTIVDDPTDTYQGKTQADDDYLPYSTFSGRNYRWSDDPVDLNPDYNINYVFVSMRKKENGVWGNFSTGVLWTKWVEDGAPGEPGETGATGATGPAGDDGESWTLEPVKELFQVKLTANQIGAMAYNNIEGHVPTKLYYAINHTVGATGTYLTTDELKSYALKLESSNTKGQKIKTINGNYNNPNDPYSGTTTVQKNGAYIPCIYYDDSNWLSYVGTPTGVDSPDIYKLYKYGATGIAYIPLQMDVQLVKRADTTKPLSERNITLSFEPDHIFSVTDSALNSVYQGLSGATGAWSTAGFSQIHQDWENINLAVGNIEDDIDGLEANVAQLDIKADQIQSTVESISNAKDNLLEDTTFDSVAATVTTGAWRQTTGSVAVNGLDDTTEKYQGSNCLIFDSRGSGSSSSLISIEQFVPIDMFDSGEPYTLSVYVKKLTNNGSNEFGLLGWTIPNGNIIDYTNMSGSAGPSETNVRVNGTGPVYDSNSPRVSWFIDDNEWHRLFITFKNIATYTTGKAMVGIRNWKSGSIGNQYLISMPKLEKGSTPSLWVPGTADNNALQSQITQTATEITATVTNGLRSTGIDITDGSISLTADNTNIWGNLSVYNDSDGITLYDTANNTIPRVSIVNHSVGNITDNFISSAITVSNIQAITRPETATSSTITLNKLSLGEFSYNPLSFSSLGLTLTSSARSEVSAMSANLYITTNSSASNGTTVFNGNLSANSTINNYFTSYTGFTNQQSLNGTYYIGGTVTINYSMPNTLSNTNRNLKISIKGNRGIEGDQKVQVIGNDGAVFKQTEQRYTWLGANYQQLRYDNSILMNGPNGLLVNQHGFQEAGASTIVDASTNYFGPIDTLPYHLINSGASNTTVNNYVSLVAGNSSVTIPAASTMPVGKQYWIYNADGANNIFITVQTDSGSYTVTLKPAHMVHFINMYIGTSVRSKTWRYYGVAMSGSAGTV